MRILMSFKRLKFLLCILALASCEIGCSESFLTNNKKSKISDGFDNDQTITSVSFISPLPNITSGNAVNYPVSGRCDPNGGDVIVVISSPSVTRSFPCGINQTFSGFIDVSAVTANPPSITARQGDLTDIALPAPVNDQAGPLSAPTATAPGSYVGGGSTYNLPILCNEVSEVVEISGVGLNPSPQTYTCTTSGLENFLLSLLVPTETASPNNLVISSADQYGNPSGSSTNVNVPIDTQGPTVVVSNGGNIVQGQVASFSVTVTELNFVSPSYIVNTSGAESSSYNCTANPCSITTGIIALSGALTLTAAVNSVSDDIGNTGDSTVRSSSLIVNTAGALGFNNPLPTINTLNAGAYLVSGSCDQALGSVTVAVTSPAVNQSIPCVAPGQFSGAMNLSAVTSNPSAISVTQGVNTVNAVPNPINDQTPITNAPTVTDQVFTNGISTTVAVNCNEVSELVTFTNVSFNPNSQTHTCAGAGSENTTLNFANPVETSDPNNVTVSSSDVNGNPTINNGSFNLPIDNIKPTVVVTAGADIVEGSNALFTVTVTDGNSFVAFTPAVTNGSVISGACSTSPCAVTVSGASAGILTLSVGSGAVVDLAGNNNTSAANDSLSVGATTLSVESAPIGTSINASSYPVSGNCDTGQGNVTVTVGTPNVTQVVSCTGSPGSYSTPLNISPVTANPMSVSASQNGNNANFAPNPINDQNGPASAPTATGPGSVVGGANYSLSINCNEAGEDVSITGDGINPDPQTYTCIGSGSEIFLLTLEQGVSFPSTNNLVLSSVDQYGNPAGTTTSVDVPVDTLGPTLAISSGGNIVEGSSASFTITVTDDNVTGLSYTPTVSSGALSPSTCTANPCNVTVSGASVGALTLTVLASSVSDDLGNTGPSSNSTSSLNVIDDPSPTITGVSIGSTDGDADSWYENSDVVSISVQFSENVTVNITGGTPTIPVTLTSGAKTAVYTSGTGTSTLNFNFSVSNGNTQCNGILAMGALALNIGTIRDSIGQNSINTGLASSVSGARVDATNPVLNGPVNISAGNALVPTDAITASWVSQTDDCGVSSVNMAIGTHNGSSCNAPTSITGFQVIGSVTSYQPVSGVAPFSGGNTFSLSLATNYCTSVSVVDAAGNSSVLRSGSWQAFPGLVINGGAYEYNGGTFAANCDEYFNSPLYNNEGDDLYRIDPDGAGGNSAYVAQCNMSYDGGGWTMVVSNGLNGTVVIPTADYLNTNYSLEYSLVANSVVSIGRKLVPMTEVLFFGVNIASGYVYEATSTSLFDLAPGQYSLKTGSSPLPSNPCGWSGISAYSSNTLYHRENPSIIHRGYIFTPHQNQVALNQCGFFHEVGSIGGKNFIHAGYSGEWRIYVR